MTVAALELDLEVFSGPFDLLLTLVLREEVDLLEVDLADVVLAYMDHLEARGELDLEVATEFLVLIAALLELKSRLMLPGDDEELLDLEPGEAAEELLARMLEARRYRSAADHLTDLLESEARWRYRSAPLPSALRRRPPEAIAEACKPDPSSSAGLWAACWECRPPSASAICTAPGSRSPSASLTCGRFCAAGEA